jgi:hypothetical protein
MPMLGKPVQQAGVVPAAGREAVQQDQGWAAGFAGLADEHVQAVDVNCAVTDSGHVFLLRRASEDRTPCGRHGMPPRCAGRTVRAACRRGMRVKCLR